MDWPLPHQFRCNRWSLDGMSTEEHIKSVSQAIVAAFHNLDADGVKCVVKLVSNKYNLSTGEEVNHDQQKH